MRVNTGQPRIYIVDFSKVEFSIYLRTSAMNEPNPTSTREAWVLCLILGVIMLNFPFLQIFNTGRSIFGIPILIFYFFIGWPISILVIFLFVQRLGKKDEGSEKSPDEEKK